MTEPTQCDCKLDCPEHKGKDCPEPAAPLPTEDEAGKEVEPIVLDRCMKCYDNVCPNCNGVGRMPGIPHPSLTADGGGIDIEHGGTCPVCKGSGLKPAGG